MPTNTMQQAAPVLLAALNHLTGWLENSEHPYARYELRREGMRAIAAAYGNLSLQLDYRDYPEGDEEYQERIITEVERTKDGAKIDCITSEMGTIGWRDDAPITPKPGDLVRYYGKGFGSIVRGLFVNGVKVWYETEAECDERLSREAAERDRTRREEFEASGKAKLDAQYKRLPKVFRKRLDRFRANNPDFRWEYEGYEMFCITEAVKIADALETPEAVKEFHDLPWETQRQRVSGLSDGHSGNTFGCACHLAYWYLKEPEAVIGDAGALSVLVGGEEYGDVPKEEPR